MVIIKDFNSYGKDESIICRSGQSIIIEYENYIFGKLKLKYFDNIVYKKSIFYDCFLKDWLEFPLNSKKINKFAKKLRIPKDNLSYYIKEREDDKKLTAMLYVVLACYIIQIASSSFTIILKLTW